MATLRGSASSYDIGNKPPTINWTVVRGDTASFKVYVTDDEKEPLVIPDWDILIKIKRPNSNPGVISDDASLVLTLVPEADADDLLGEFTVSLASSESQILETGDIFDIQLTSAGQTNVWTVAQGSMIILEDVTD